jgi:protein-disulfide isomerase
MARARATGAGLAPPSQRMPSRSAPSRAAPTPAVASRGALWTALVLGLLGLAVSIFLVRLHAQAHAGIASFCAINETFNCDRVATSRYSVVLGLPVAMWGAIGFAATATLAASGLSRRRPTPTWPAGLLALGGVAAVTVSLALALVSKLAIGSWCLMCVVAWLLALALLAAGFRASRATGIASAVRSDLAAVRARPGRTAALAVLAFGGIAAASAAYPRYWQRSVAAVTPPPGGAVGGSAGGAGAPAPAAVPRAPDGRAIVTVFSDYECPFCAQAHEEARAVLARRPDVQLVHRQFPLDPSCNPAVKRAIHPTACALARAGLCAEDQGRLPEMDDALFRNQVENRPVLELAQRIGLDLDRFRTCLTSPGTDRRLAADIEAGIRAGIRATPSYVVGDQVRSGTFPLDLLPPPAAAGR